MKTTFLLFLSFVFFGFNAQTITAHYEQTKIDDENSALEKDKGYYNDEEFEKLKSFMNLPRNFTLTFSNGVSIFTEEEIMDDESAKEVYTAEGDAFTYRRTKSEDLWYKDFNNRELIASESILNRLFIIDESFKNIDWKIENDEKQIGDFLCKKATATINGVDVLAYYTEEIPVPDGPKFYFGLPGLILELQDNKNMYVLTSLQMTEESSNFEKPDKGKAISRENFENLKTEKTNRY